MNTKSTIPEMDRWIRIHGHDWSAFHVIGKCVPYKSPPNKPGRWRFMARQKNGTMEAQHENWKDCEKWEYCEESEKP